MAQTETTQFFQFDREGNMFIFAPGAGCTGPTKLVKSGDELIFNSSYNPMEWVSESTVLSSVANGLLSTCPGEIGSAACEFKDPLPDEDLAELTHKNFSSETMRQIRWVRKMYREWCHHHHSSGLQRVQCDLEDKATITAASLKFALCCFIMEIKKVNGDDFPGKTPYHIIVCIQFHLECLGFAFKLINDPCFKDLKFTLDNTMKACTLQGIGISVCRAEVLRATDEDLLWSLGYLGTENPDQLLNTVIFCVGKGFALHVGKEHRALHGLPFNSQFTFMKDQDREVFM